MILYTLKVSDTLDGLHYCTFRGANNIDNCHFTIISFHPIALILYFFNIIPTPFINVLYYAFAYKSSTFTKYNSHTLLPKAIPLLIIVAKGGIII